MSAKFSLLGNSQFDDSLKSSSSVFTVISILGRIFCLKSFSTFQLDTSEHDGYYNLSYDHKDKEIRYFQCNCLFAFVIVSHIF